MAESTADRLTRLLALITYLASHPEVPVAQVAEHFGITEAQVLADVNLLWVSGTPGYLPDDLIDFEADEYDQQLLTLTEPRGMDRPLRLAPTEALALLVAVRSLHGLVDEGALDEEALASTAAKLVTAAGQAAEAAGAVSVDVGQSGTALPAVRRSVAEQRVLHLRYVSAADVVTTRDVDPIEIVFDGQHSYLRAWCRRVAAMRHFRLDRVLEAHLRSAPAQQHEASGSIEPQFGREAPVVELDLASPARWVAEQLPVEETTELDDGGLRVRLAVADPAWLANLVLGLGTDVRAIRPSEFAEAVAGQAREAVAAYESLA